jgi:hypothetical protein
MYNKTLLQGIEPDQKQEERMNTICIMDHFRLLAEPLRENIAKVIITCHASSLCRGFDLAQTHLLLIIKYDHR